MCGCTPTKLSINFGITTYQTLSDCIKELIEASYNIYTILLSKKKKISIICGGQSPSYYCLAMMHFKIFNPELVNIIVLPHSKNGEISKNVHEENINYCNRLLEKNIKVYENIVIIDGVHSGTGIIALESALLYTFPYIKSVYKIAINAMKGISKILVDMEVIVPCEPKFSDVFPRLVTPFYSTDFKDASKFITKFINVDINPVAQMIIYIAKCYPDITIENLEYYKLNNVITPEIAKKKEEQQKKQLKETLMKKAENEAGYFKPIILFHPKRYKCPLCNCTSGTLAPKNPSDLSLFPHDYYCINKFKIAKESI